MRFNKLVLIGLVLFSTSGHGRELFGEEVAKCVVEKHHAQPSKSYSIFFSECEATVEKKRKAEDNKAIEDAAKKTINPYSALVDSGLDKDALDKLDEILPRVGSKKNATAKQFPNLDKTYDEILDWQLQNPGQTAKAVSKTGGVTGSPIMVFFLVITFLYGIYRISRSGIIKVVTRATYDSCSCSGNIYKNAGVDFLLFFVGPASVYQILEATDAFDGHNYSGSHSSTFTALMVALASCGLAYLVAFVTLGRYAALNFRQRFNIMLPIFLFTTAYWVVLETANIANGYGEGNVMSLLFGLSVAGVIAWRRVAAASAS